MLNKLVQLKHITDGGLGAEPPEVGQFFFEKQAILMPLDNIPHVFKAIGRNYKFLAFESQLKKLNCSILLLLTI